jgi:radical SAM-linked protein
MRPKSNTEKDMKYLANFLKEGRMVYISHLDLQRMVLRALRMAGLRPAYTQGFHPHAKLSLALPLSLGYASDDEYFEFEIERDIDPAEAADRLNAVFPAGVRVKRIFAKPDAVRKSLASLITAVTYEIRAISVPENDNVWDNDRIAAAIQAWNGEKSAALSLSASWGNKVVFTITLSAENGNVPNPLKRFSDFLQSAGRETALEILSVKRTKILIPGVSD